MFTCCVRTQMHTGSRMLRVCELTNDRMAEPTPKDLAWSYDVVCASRMHNKIPCLRAPTHLRQVVHA